MRWRAGKRGGGVAGELAADDAAELLDDFFLLGFVLGALAQELFPGATGRARFELALLPDLNAEELGDSPVAVATTTGASDLAPHAQRRFAGIARRQDRRRAGAQKRRQSRSFDHHFDYLE